MPQTLYLAGAGELSLGLLLAHVARELAGEQHLHNPCALEPEGQGASADGKGCVCVCVFVSSFLLYSTAQAYSQS